MRTILATRRLRLLLSCTMLVASLLPSSTVLADVYLFNQGALQQYPGGINGSLPYDLATRAETVRLIVDATQGTRNTVAYNQQQYFADVFPGSWQAQYFDEAARRGWVRGDYDCLGRFSPCFARPDFPLTRAEAAAFIVRAFSFQRTGTAQRFSDNRGGQWYEPFIQIAADHCILQGDLGTSQARPEALVTRTELQIMITRATGATSYGVNCNRNVGSQYSPYYNAAPYGAQYVNQYDTYSPYTTYITPYPQYQQYPYYNYNQTTRSEASIDAVVPVSLTRIRVDFNIDLDINLVQNVNRYQLSGGPNTLTVYSASLVGPRSVELRLSREMEPRVSYTLYVNNMNGLNGRVFSDSMDFRGYGSTRDTYTGSLSVYASSSNSELIVNQGSRGNIVLSLTMSASCDRSKRVYAITLQNSGGIQNYISAMYLTQGNSQLTPYASLNGSSVTLRLTNALTIPACQSMSVNVVADLQSYTGGSNVSLGRMSVNNTSDIQTDANNVNGSFPLYGPYVRTI